MQEIDMEKLRKKAESGATEEEQVNALVKKLEIHVKDTTTAQRFLAEERKARVMVEIEHQLVLKEKRKQREKYEEDVEFLRTVDYLTEEQRKEHIRQEEKAAEKLRVQHEIKEQLKDRERRRIIELEMKEQESALLARQAKQAAEAQEAANRAKVLVAKQLAKDTMDANRRFAERDARRIAKEREDDRLILEYQIQKAAAAAEIEKAKAEEKAYQEKVTAELRAAQKRAMDNKGAEDEAKARRHEEARILKERARAKLEAEQKEKSKHDMIEAVERQLILKAQRKEDEKRNDATLAELARRDIGEALQRDSAHQAQKKAERNQAYVDLRLQKLEADKVKAKEAKRPLEERQQQALVEAAEKIVIENFRHEVLGRMQKDHLNETFTNNVTNIIARK